MAPLTESPELFCVESWFREHVTLEGKPYTLDPDQIRTVVDDHKNTLVTARAGSGKTRVIVAKITYLIAYKKIWPSRIAAFMFNRTAAAEVNSRLASVKVDGKTLAEIASRSSAATKASSTSRSGAANSDDEPKPLHIASTFHSFALRTLRFAGESPEIISEAEQAEVAKRAFEDALKNLKITLSPSDREEYLRLTTSFITRAGQRFPGENGRAELAEEMASYLEACDDPYRFQLHSIAYKSFQNYQKLLEKQDFNQLLHSATEIILQNCPECLHPRHDSAIRSRYSNLSYLLVDEYQDFSYLFYSLIEALRAISPSAHFFAVGDDWQAINRFAGSDVDYFLNFASYYPENSINIPLLTNYRSDRRIVANANRYMLRHYDPSASPATAFSDKNGRILRKNLNHLRFDSTDIHEDALGDGRYQKVLEECLPKESGNKPKNLLPAAKLLKQTVKIIRRHRKEEIMLLHRHNFTSTLGVTLDVFMVALEKILLAEEIMNREDFYNHVCILTMHRSKGLESNIVILLEFNREQVLGHHPSADLFTLFGDSLKTEKADQHRLIYVALTRAKHRLYLISSDKKPIC